MVLSVFCLAVWVASKIWTIGYGGYSERYENGRFTDMVGEISVDGSMLKIHFSVSSPIAFGRSPGRLESEWHWVFQRRAKRTGPGAADAVRTGQPSGEVGLEPPGIVLNCAEAPEGAFPPEYPWWHWGNLKPVHVEVRIAEYPGFRRYNRSVFIELWAIFLLCAISTALLWWRERRYKGDGICKECGYDLTGNVSGICPECGTGISPDRRRCAEASPGEAVGSNWEPLVVIEQSKRVRRGRGAVNPYIWLLGLIPPVIALAAGLAVRNLIVVRLDRCYTAIILSEDGLLMAFGDFNRALHRQFPTVARGAAKHGRISGRKVKENKGLAAAEEETSFDTDVVGGYLSAACRYAEVDDARSWGPHFLGLPVHYPGACRFVLVRFSVIGMTLLAAMPVLLCWVFRCIRRWIGRRRLRRGFCPQCQYNLTGNISGICPECGTTVAPRDRVVGGMPPIFPAR